MKLVLVVPCYMEQDMLPISAPRLGALLDDMIGRGDIGPESHILFVNDGSTDRTWSIIRELNSQSPLFHGLNLAANVGHQNAIMAGMFTAVDGAEPADAVITIDADLQDPLECIPEMVAEFKKGFDVVYGVRVSRESDSFLKRFTAESFYKMQASLGLKTIYNHADFRLMSRRVVRELERYEERNMYLRGVIPMIGFPSTTVDEVRARREAGVTKYTLSKMMTLALDGVTSFSIKPMYMILSLGLISLVIALGIAIYVIISLVSRSTVPGWTSLMLSIWLVGGMVMLSIGMVGLYVGKAYLETKHRPRYHIAEQI